MFVIYEFDFTFFHCFPYLFCMNNIYFVSHQKNSFVILSPNISFINPISFLKFSIGNNLLLTNLIFHSFLNIIFNIFINICFYTKNSYLYQYIILRSMYVIKLEFLRIYFTTVKNRKKQIGWFIHL